MFNIVPSMKHKVKHKLKRNIDINFKTNKMAKQKSEVFSISLNQKHKAMAKSQSALVLGKENISGYFAYLLEKENKTLSE